MNDYTKGAILGLIIIIVIFILSMTIDWWLTK